MDEAIIRAVRSRAGRACEYCRLSESIHPGPFEVEHVIPSQHGGAATLGNLAYACLHCNRHKGPNLSGIDSATSRTKLVRLFNPRRHKWERHFRWEGPPLVGKTPIDRVTVHVLAMNDPVRVALRQELIDEGLFPPA
jgi:5-methylcytosine-specific restriction endonuclease McrA